MLLRPLHVSFLAVLVWTCLLSGLAPLAQPVVAAAHPRPVPSWGAGTLSALSGTLHWLSITTWPGA